MWNFSSVAAVAYRGGWVLRVEFDDGLAGELDFSHYLDRGPVCAPLRDQEFFRTAHVANGTVSWPNGADIAPETLYERLEQAAAAKGRRPARTARRPQGVGAAGAGSGGRRRVR